LKVKGYKAGAPHLQAQPSYISLVRHKHIPSRYILEALPSICMSFFAALA